MWIMHSGCGPLKKSALLFGVTKKRLHSENQLTKIIFLCETFTKPRAQTKALRVVVAQPMYLKFVGPRTPCNCGCTTVGAAWYSTALPTKTTGAAPAPMAVHFPMGFIPIRLPIPHPWAAAKKTGMAPLPSCGGKPPRAFQPHDFNLTGNSSHQLRYFCNQ